MVNIPYFTHKHPLVSHLMEAMVAVVKLPSSAFEKKCHLSKGTVDFDVHQLRT